MLVHSPQFTMLPAGESSPTSPHNFRQLDDVFLQTQTRIWLGEVLRTRLNEERSIADLLADGELLFEVSKEVWKMMLSKRSELNYEYEPFPPRNSGRYMPYSFVDSFLRMCKILGLNGIDLFSPSDVVERGDTRKVCVCLRAFSKKARSMDLDVPDFDNVTYTVAMPTDMVECIRRSWELSLSEYSSSSSPTQNQTLRQISSQEHLNEVCGRDYSFVKEFGDSETNSVPQADSLTTNCPYKSSSDISSKSVKAKSGCSDACFVHLGIETQKEEELCSSKLQGSLLLHQLDDDKQEENVVPLSVVDSNSQFGGRFSNVENGSENSYRSRLVDQIYHTPNLEEEESVVEGVLQSKKNTDENEHKSQFLDGDDVEVSSVGSLNSMSINVRKLDFDDDLSFPKTTEGSIFQDGMVHSTLSQILSTDGQEESLKVNNVNIGLAQPKCFIAHSGICTSGYIDPVMPYDNNIFRPQTDFNTEDGGKESFVDESHFSHGFSQWDQKGKTQISTEPTGNGVSDALYSSSLLDHSYQYIQGEVSGDALQHDKINSTIVDNGNMDKLSALVQTNDGFTPNAKTKLQKRPLLKAVVGGTAVAGATLLFLHLRNNGVVKSGELGKKSNGGRRSRNGWNLLSGKEQKDRKADGVYSSEKLKL